MMIMIIIMVMVTMIVRYVDGGGCILAVHSLSQFQLNKGTLDTTGGLPRAQKAMRIVGRFSV
jgi:hypothetical protein